jgi:hypothetical protein
MSAEKKPGEPAEIPPFLQKRGTATADPGKPAESSKSGEEPVGIPFFLRSGAAKAAPKVDPKVASSPAPQRAAPSHLAAASAPEPVSPPGDLMSPEEVQKALADAQAERLRQEQQSDAERAAYLQGSQIDKQQMPVSEKSAYKPIDWENATDIFDHMVTGIRKDRAENKREEHETKRKFETDWQHVVASMQRLEQKVKGNPRLIYFNIARDFREITVKMVDETSKQRYRLITLTRDHPSGKFKTMEVVWLIEYAGRERYFMDAKEAMAEVVTIVASTLA